jgi:N-acyl amino acid synthase of PEP-CTERM/exosortase system
MPLHGDLFDRCIVNDWLDTFDRYFEIAPAQSPADLMKALALRYQVYCIEHPFEDSGRHRDGHERDEFDPRSIHSILTHRTSGDAAATVRLVLSDADNPDQMFPIEQHCALDYPLWSAALRNFDRKEIAEISRFAVSKQFRRRHGEPETTHGVVNPFPVENINQERRVLPQITLGLFQAIVRMSKDHEIKLWVAVMEPTLLRLLRRFGIYFTPVGEPVDYHGLRVPCVGPVDEVMDGIRRSFPEVFDFITCGSRLWPY